MEEYDRPHCNPPIESNFATKRVGIVSTEIALSPTKKSFFAVPATYTFPLASYETEPSEMAPSQKFVIHVRIGRFHFSFPNESNLIKLRTPLRSGYWVELAHSS